MSELVTTSQPAGSLDRWRDKAKAEGLSLSEWVGKVCNDACGIDVKRRKRGRPVKSEANRETK